METQAAVGLVSINLFLSVVMFAMMAMFSLLAGAVVYVFIKVGRHIIAHVWAAMHESREDILARRVFKERSDRPAIDIRGHRGQ